MSIKQDDPPMGTVARVATENPSAENIVLLGLQAFAHGIAINKGKTNKRVLTARRVGKDGTVLIENDYLMPQGSIKGERYIEFPNRVSGFPGARLEVEFDDCGANETQWILMVYGTELQ